MNELRFFCSERVLRLAEKGWVAPVEFVMFVTLPRVGMVLVLVLALKCQLSFKFQFVFASGQNFLSHVIKGQVMVGCSGVLVQLTQG